VADFALRLLDDAALDLEQLDKVMARRIVRRLQWLLANLESITPVPLKGSLAGLFKLRVGSYRVLYEVLRDEQVIVVHMIGHRRDIYRQD